MISHRVDLDDSSNSIDKINGQLRDMELNDDQQIVRTRSGRADLVENELI